MADSNERDKRKDADRADRTETQPAEEWGQREGTARQIASGGKESPGPTEAQPGGPPHQKTG